VTVDTERVLATVWVSVNVDVAAGAVTVIVGPCAPACAPARTSSGHHSRVKTTTPGLRGHILLLLMVVDVFGLRQISTKLFRTLGKEESGSGTQLHIVLLNNAL
jgi:hypothetical protein